MNLSPEQTKSIKNKVDTLELNFQEVDKGYTYKMMLEEADRCLSCKHEPCVKACPLHLPIPQFISALKTGDVETANELIRTKSDFSAFCSRVCDVAKQCEEVCVRAIKHEAVGINYLERYVSDNHQLKLHKKPPLNGKRVAIIGSGLTTFDLVNYLSHEKSLKYPIGIFTNNQVTRQALFQHIMLLLKGQWEYWKQHL